MTSTTFVDLVGPPVNAAWLNDVNGATYNGSAVYTPAGTGAVATTVQTKLRESVSVKDFGAIGNGTADDTAPLIAALNAAYEVVVPVGMNLKITSTVTVPAKTKLRFLGGETNGGVTALPSFITKSASMTTAAIALDNGAVVEGGGLICTAGNAGDGVYIYGNSAALRKFHVYGAGGNGVRVGSTDTSGAGNTNSFELYKVVSEHNTGSGFLFNDSSTLAGPNANAGTIYQCFANANGGDGFRVQHSFWNTFINCLSETNTGYGLYFSGTLIGGYSEARYHTVLGGDYNEGNTAGVIYNLGYKCLVINPDTYTKPTPSNGTGYEGGYLAGRYSTLYGLELVGDPLTLTSGQVVFPATQIPSANANTLDDYEEGTWTPVLTFQTPGNLSVTYAAQVGKYTKIGNSVTLQCNIVTSAFTFTTASGYLRITGLPYGATTLSGVQNFGALLFQGITKAGYTNFVASVENALPDSVLIYCSGSGVATDFVKATDTPTAGTVQLKFTITYEALN